ncbi:MAG TPA: alkaline phosphatase family protein [Candidatus Sulfotelmatobacter sp.]|nr:alkaline phosphatase family protein [Candidatus Sulfotelmatobacter sp.]
MKFTAKALAFFVALGTAAVGYAQIPFPNPIKHVIVVIQENRTPDNLFQGLLTWPGINPSHYNIATSGQNSKGQTIVLQPTPLAIAWDLAHSHSAFTTMYDGGKMDGADKVACGGTCPPNPAFHYVENAAHILDPYFTLAADYGWANFMFQTNQGPSYPAHQFLFGGTSAPSFVDDYLGLFIAENPTQPKGSNYTAFSDTGCLAPVGEFNQLIQANGTETKQTNTTPGTFCYTRNTMATLLDHAGLTWKYYAQKQGNPNGTNPGGSIWTAPNSIRAICDPDSGYTVCTGSEWNNNVDLIPAHVLTDISGCKLPNVTWVTPIGKNSDHAGSVNTFGGPSWVASIVNAVGKATTCEGGRGYWSDTAILITWDDWGGWFDHEAPPLLNSPIGDYQYGFRVPLLVVSAYTPRAFVSNKTLDFGSALRFIEGVFNIPEGALGFADARASNDLGNFFDFRHRPRAFATVPAALDANFFINDTTASEPPDND